MNITSALYDAKGRPIPGPTPWITGTLALVQKRKCIYVARIGGGIRVSIDAMLTDSDGASVAVWIGARVVGMEPDHFIDQWIGDRIRVKGILTRMETGAYRHVRSGKVMPVTVAVEQIAPLFYGIVAQRQRKKGKGSGP